MINNVILTSEDLLKQQLARVPASRARKAKPVPLSKGVGIQFNAELQRIVRAIRKDINEILMPKLRALAPEYTRDSNTVIMNDAWTDDLLATLRLILDKWRSPTMRNVGDQIARPDTQAVEAVGSTPAWAVLGLIYLPITPSLPITST